MHRRCTLAAHVPHVLGVVYFVLAPVALVNFNVFLLACILSL